MITVQIPETELYNEATGRFMQVKGITIQLEHSLISLSKWESKWHKPFIATKDKTHEEFIDYLRCMTLTKNVDPNAYYAIPGKTMTEISNYINDPMTATTFTKNQNEKDPMGKNKIVTAEIIYYYMVTLGIPVEFERWHLNRLLTLIKVVSIKNTPPKKMSRDAVLARNSKLNRARRARSGSRG